MMTTLVRRMLPLVLLVLPLRVAARGSVAPPSTGSLAGFGGAVAVAGTDVLVGEPRPSGKPGVVHVYRMDAQGQWKESAQIRASDGAASDGFGMAIATNGNHMVVSAVSDATGRGRFYEFQRDDAGMWKEVARVEAPTDTAATLFGFSIDLDGDNLMIGAPLEAGTGVAHLYHRDGPGRWSHAARVVPSNGQENGGFGVVVALSGERALAASPATGVSAFQLASGAWVDAGTVESPGGPVPAFGRAIQLEGDFAFVGSPVEANRVGAVRIFRFDAATGKWTGVGILKPTSQEPSLYGAAIALDGDRLWVGAMQANQGRGAAFTYRRSETGEWTLSATVSPENGSVRDHFGGALAVSGDIAVVGMADADFGAGKAAIYQAGQSTVAWTPAGTVFSEIETFPAVTGGEVRCATGTASSFGCGQVDLLSFLPIAALGGSRGVDLNDIWGWTDPVSGKEYALVGRVDGTSFVDISDPVRPVYVGSLPLTDGAEPNAWRDIKVYKDHAYIVADGAGQHGMQVFDLTRLRDYKGTPLDFKAVATYDRIASAHNIVINEESGFAYAVGASSGGETCGGGLHMIDIREPATPKFAGCFSDPQTGRSGTGYSHDAQCVMYHGPDADYAGREICIGSNETMLSVADVTDKANPKAVARASYPNVGYTHQGWFTDDQKFFYVDDELDEMNGLVNRTRTLIWDMTDLDDPQLVKEFLGTTEASDHNLYVRGRYVYQSDYAAGLRILDISNPLEPVEVGFFDTQPVGENKPAFTGSWSNYPFFRSGVIAVSSIEQGLFLLRFRPTRPVS